MSISIIISHESNEVLNANFFADQLERKWPGTKIHFISESDAPLFQFKTPEDFRIRGDFLGTGVSFKGDNRVEDARFALWYRSVVPQEWKLRVYDMDLTFAIFSLTHEATEEDVIAFFNMPFDSDISEQMNL